MKNQIKTKMPEIKKIVESSDNVLTKCTKIYELLGKPYTSLQNVLTVLNVVLDNQLKNHLEQELDENNVLGICHIMIVRLITNYHLLREIENMKNKEKHESKIIIPKNSGPQLG